MTSIKEKFANLPKQVNWRVCVLLLAGIIAILLLFLSAYLSRYSLRNPDGLSYISIAQHYTQGNFDTAVNAYWSPMISWLMIPLLKIGIEGQLALVLVNALASSFALMLGMYLIWKQTNRNFLLPLLFLATLTPFLMHAIEEYTPDVLVLPWVILFVYALLKVEKLIGRQSLKADVLAGIMLGLVGALGYYIKVYTLPVYLGVVIIWATLCFFNKSVKHKKNNANHAFSTTRILTTAIVVFIVTLAPWVAMMSAKYETFIISSSFSVNMGAPNPVSRTHQSEEHIRKLPPLLPQDPTLVQATATTSGNSSSPEEAGGLENYVNERFEVLPFYLNRIFSIAPFIIPVMVALGVALLFGKVTYIRHKAIVLSGLVFLIYFLGYPAIVRSASGGGNVRYYWPLFVLSLMIMCMAIPYLWSALKGLSRLRKSIFVLLVIIAPLAVFTQYAYGMGYPFSLPVSTSGTIMDSRRSGVLRILNPSEKSSIVLMADRLKQDDIIRKGDKIASNTDREARYFALNLEVTGVSFNKMDFRDQSDIKILKQNGVDYFINFVPNERTEPLSDAQHNIVATYNHHNLPCDGARWIKPEPCTLQIIEL